MASTYDVPRMGSSTRLCAEQLAHRLSHQFAHGNDSTGCQMDGVRLQWQSEGVYSREKGQVQCCKSLQKCPSYSCEVDKPGTSSRDAHHDHRNMGEER